MKIRIGMALGAGNDLNDHASLAHVVDELERLRFDSLWFTERINGPSLDPIVAMTFAAARTTKLKVGTSVMVLPGRNPVLLAKALASLDRVSDGRCLPAFGLGAVNAAEHQAFGVQRSERVPWFDEALPLMRRLWSEESVTHHGARFHLDEARVEPKPTKGSLDVWLGGASPAELRRCGRLGDGWLPSFCTPTTVREGIALVHEAAGAAGRAVDPEHFGVLLPLVHAPEIPEPLAAVVRQRHPDADPSEAISTDLAQVRERIEAFIEVGASKFVVLPYGPVPDWTAELEAMAERLLPLEN